MTYLLYPAAYVVRSCCVRGPIRWFPLCKWDATVPSTFYLFLHFPWWFAEPFFVVRYVVEKRCHLTLWFFVQNRKWTKFNKIIVNFCRKTRVSWTKTWKARAGAYLGYKIQSLGEAFFGYIFKTYILSKIDKKKMFCNLTKVLHLKHLILQDRFVKFRQQ